MSELTYKNGRWEGTLQRADGEKILVYMSDETLQRHLVDYLKGIGVPTQTYMEMLRYVQHVQAQQYRAFQQLLDLERWLSCDDPEVRIISTHWQKYANRYQ
jgi:hypothetical protein